MTSGHHPELSFPGLRDAMAAGGEAVQWLGPDPTEEHGEFLRSMAPFTEYGHIASVSLDREFTIAQICIMSVPESPSNLHGMPDVVEVVLSHPPGEVGESGVRDDGSGGPADPPLGRYPTWNVYAPWKIHQAQFPSEAEITYDQICGDWLTTTWPGIHRKEDGRWVMPDGNSPHHALARQYPKWLGPHDVTS